MISDNRSSGLAGRSGSMTKYIDSRIVNIKICHSILTIPFVCDFFWIGRAKKSRLEISLEISCGISDSSISKEFCAFCITLNITLGSSMVSALMKFLQYLVIRII